MSHGIFCQCQWQLVFLPTSIDWDSDLVLVIHMHHSYLASGTGLGCTDKGARIRLG
jgi:hypothetical protein